MIPGPFDVVTVPFPFSDRARSKRRPALVVSSRAFNRSAGASIFAMITSGTTRWPGDVALDYCAAGLAQACVVRLKLFTLDNRLILHYCGQLSLADRGRWMDAMREFLAHDNDAEMAVPEEPASPGA